MQCKKNVCTPNDSYVDQITSEVLSCVLGNNYAFLSSTNIYEVPTFVPAPFFSA